jgi:FKBP-type peptidyl-prolyl cis-trans isomerase (trigger factor)
MKTNNSNLSKLDNGTFTLKVTLDQKEIENEYQNILKNVQANHKSKGFRQGKVPLNIVEKEISREKIIEEMLSHLLSHKYEDQIKENELKPVLQPQIKILNPPLTLDKSWEIEITSCELPNIELNEEYQNKIKSINNTKANDKLNREEKLNKILEVIVNSSSVTMPPILLEAEVERKLSQLVDQLNQAKLTVNQYLQNKNQTLDQYKEEIEKHSIEEWKINLSIDYIAKKENIEIKPEEAKAYLEKNPQLSENINLLYYILIQEKVFDYLLNLK